MSRLNGCLCAGANVRSVANYCNYASMRRKHKIVSEIGSYRLMCDMAHINFGFVLVFSYT